MLNGFATQNVYAADLDAAAGWYTDVLGIEPYFRRPGYVEFRVGPFENEFGIIDASWKPDGADQPGGAILYWQVDDVTAVYEDLLARGATSYQPVIPRGEGFVTASVVDPFGNLLGVMENVHFAEMRSRLT